jgi:glycosyltransferase involved in cell wall biosynthesis
VLNNGVEIININNRSRRNTDKFIILYVGVVSIRKGVHHLIDAFHNLSSPNIELVLVGDIAEGETLFFETLFQNDNRIKKIGHVPHIQIGEWYNAADVFVFPTLSDSFGMVVTELQPTDCNHEHRNKDAYKRDQ